MDTAIWKFRFLLLTYHISTSLLGELKLSALSDFLDEKLDLLDCYGFGWTDGGCWILAVALVAALGSEARIGHAIVDPWENEGHHYYVMLNGYCIDYHGVRPNKEFEDDFRMQFPGEKPYFEEAEWRYPCVVENSRVSRMLAEAIAPHLGHLIAIPAPAAG